MNKNINILKLVIINILILNNFQVSFGHNENQNEEPKIVIVGAGASGIAAAAKLFENGFKNVTILEAEDYVGGRVHTVQFGDYYVDLGGQWVDGEEGNKVFEIVYPLGLLDKSDSFKDDFKEIFFTSSGEVIDANSSSKIMEFFFDHIYLESVANNSLYKSLGDYAEKLFDEKFKDIPEIYNEKKKYLEHLELFALGDIAAESWHDIALLSENEYNDCEGNHFINWKEKGYSTILDILTKRYPNPEDELPVLNNTILKSEVITIDYSKNITEPISIITSNGKSYIADHVIVTIPLGALKEKYDSLFVPHLPDYKIEAIKGIGFGAVGKIYLLFDKPFWNVNDEKGTLHLTFIWNDADKKLIEADPERAWLLGMTVAFSLPYKQNLLELWMAGKYVKMMEKIPDEKILKYSMENLRRFMSHKYNVTEPIKIFRTQWHSNPHFCGTYSYRSVETQKRKITSEMLERSIVDEKLKILFAGEATSDDRYGTVDGAIGTGWKAADKLINFYKK